MDGGSESGVRPLVPGRAGIGEQLMDVQSQDFPDELERRLETIHVALSRNKLSQILSGQPDTPESKKLTEEMHQILLDPAILERVQALQESAESPLLERRLSLLAKRFTIARVRNLPQIANLSSGMEAIIASWRPKVGQQTSSQEEVARVLKNSGDRNQRKIAWYAYKGLSNALAGDFLKLVGLRNAVAREMGYGSYVDLILWERGLTVLDVDNLASNVLKSINERYLEYLSRVKVQEKIDSIEPWDLGFLIERELAHFDGLFDVRSFPEAAARLARMMGVAPEPGMIKVDPSDSFAGGLCLAVEVPSDIHIVFGRVEPGYKGYLQFFHEYGHALYYSHIEQPHYSLKYLELSCFVESTGPLFEWIALSDEWMGESVSLNQNSLARMKGARETQVVLELMKLINEFRFLSGIYSNPKQDIDDLWTKTVEGTLGYRDESGHWAMIGPHVVQQDYLLAHLIAIKTLAALSTRYGERLDDPHKGPALVGSYFAPGASIDWKRKVEGLVGELDGEIMFPDHPSTSAMRG